MMGFFDCDECDGFVDRARLRAEHGVRAVAARARRRRSRSGGGLLGVLGDVDEHRAGAAGGGDLEGFAQGRRDVFGARDEEVVLGDGQRDAGDVDFLKGVGAEHLGRPGR